MTGEGPTWKSLVCLHRRETYFFITLPTSSEDVLGNVLEKICGEKSNRKHSLMQSKATNATEIVIKGLRVILKKKNVFTRLTA